MPTTINPPSSKKSFGNTVRVVGTITKDPEQFTSKSGNSCLRLSVVVDPATAGCTPTWWNITIMEGLFRKLPEGLIEKRRYVKFVGVGETREYDKKTGGKGYSNDMIASGIEMQNGEFIQSDKKEPGDEG